MHIIMESLTNVYEEVCRLELKYKHLTSVCRTLLQPWSDRDEWGRRAVNKSQRQLQDGDPEQDCRVVRDEASKEMADLQALDNILSRAQRVREGDKMRKNRTTPTTSMAMATLAYGQSKPPPSKKATPRSKPPPSTNKVVKPSTSVSEKRPHPLPAEDASNEMTPDSFSLQTNGQRLSMVSRYTKLKHLLTRVNEQQAVSHSASSGGAQHFTQRLLSQDCVGQTATIATLLAVEECALLREELLGVSPSELAVSEKLPWQDLLRVKHKLDTVLTRAGRLSAQTNPGSAQLVPSHVSNDPRSLTQHPFRCVCPREQFYYVELKELKQLCLLEQELVLEKWRLKFAEFIGETVIPLLLERREQLPVADVCVLLQCVYKLLAVSQSETGVSYVFVDQ